MLTFPLDQSVVLEKPFVGAIGGLTDVISLAIHILKG